MPLSNKGLTCQHLFSRARNPVCTADPKAQPHNPGVIYTLAHTNMTTHSNITFGILLRNTKSVGYVHISSLIICLKLHHRHNDTWSQRHMPGYVCVSEPSPQHSSSLPKPLPTPPRKSPDADRQIEVFKYQLDLIRSIFCSRSWVGGRLKNNEYPQEDLTITLLVQREANSRKPPLKTPLK